MKSRVFAPINTPLLGLLTLTAACAQADVVYEVGPGKTYSTIQAALNAIPDSPTTFTQNHIVRVFTSTNNFFSTPNFANQPTTTGRLIIEANPGDRVIIDSTNNKIRDRNVVVRGFVFTPKTAGVGTFSSNEYLLLAEEAAAPRSGLVVYQNEFTSNAVYKVGGKGLDASGDFELAFVNNYHHDAWNAGAPVRVGLTNGLKSMIAGNVFARQYAVGASLQVSGTNTAHWLLHNTFYQVSMAFDFPNGSNLGDLVLANNLIDQVETGEFGYRFTGAPFASFPDMEHNLMRRAGTAKWARASGAGDYTTLSAWNTFLTNNGYNAEVGSLDGVDPQFENVALSNFRILDTSPAHDAATATNYFLAAANDLDILALLTSYNNSVLNLGYQGPYYALNIGALIPEPSTVALGVCGLALSLCRRRLR